MTLAQQCRRRVPDGGSLATARPYRRRLRATQATTAPVGARPVAARRAAACRGSRRRNAPGRPAGGVRTSRPDLAALSVLARRLRRRVDPPAAGRDSAQSRAPHADRDARARGGRPPKAVDLVLREDASLVGAAAAAELLAFLPASQSEEILDACGLSVAVAPRRDAAFRTLVLMAYEGRCAICGWDVQLAGQLVGLEAAHVWQWS